MENKSIVIARHAPVNVKMNNPIYINQLDGATDFLAMDVTSRAARDKEWMEKHPTWTMDLSPLFIGPVMASDGKLSRTLENLWQYSKVFEGDVTWRVDGNRHIKEEKRDIRHTVLMDRDGNPTPEFFANREFGFNDYPGNRRPYIGKAAYHYFVNENGVMEKLGYVESRKKVYIPVYAKAVVQTESYKWLKKMVDEGKKICLLDFDAYNYYSASAMKKYYKTYVDKCKKNHHDPVSEEKFMNIHSIKDVINCPYLAAGHAFVLKMLLEGDIEVVDGKVIDHIGVLD